MVGTVVQTAPNKPTAERFSTGKLKPKVASGTDSPPPPATKRGCYVCGTIQRGDTFTALPDERGITRTIHTPIHAEDGKSVDRNVGCLEMFVGRVTAAQKQAVQEQKETLALSALRREGNGQRVAELAQSLEQSREIFDCSVEGCPRFFDSQNGADLHLRRGHKVGVGHKAE